MTTAGEYNRKQIELGFITDRMLQELVACFQRKNHLKPDGWCGPETQEAILLPFAGMFPDVGVIARSALAFAVSEIGHGEEGGNNSGQYVEAYKGMVFDGDDDDDGAWCAAFVSWCFQRAASALGVELPFQLSQGAKALFKLISEAGELVSHPQPGDVVCWDRGKPGSWQGHIGFVESYEGGILRTVEGNNGRFPAKVSRFMYDLEDETRLIGFARCP